MEPTEAAAAAPPKGDPRVWNMFVVDDEDKTRADIKEWFEGASFPFGKIVVDGVGNFEEAAERIRSRKIDILILDVYMGKKSAGEDQAGVKLLADLKKTGFVCTVFYTGLVTELAGLAGPFVRVVKKDDGLKKIQAEVEDLFARNLPQVVRGIFGHIDQTLAAYLWGFVDAERATFAELENKPDFLRLLARRLGDSLARDGARGLVEEIFGPQGSEAERAHPTELYIKPPLAKHPVLGDIRTRQVDGAAVHLVVVWPSCDLVEGDGRTPKVDKVLVVRADDLSKRDEAVKHAAAPSKKSQEKVGRVVQNKVGDRFHFMPAAFDIPNLVADFGAIEALPYAELAAMPCLATLASPFAEALASRFQSYSGRLGTKDLDFEALIAKVAPVPGEGQT